MRKAESGLKLSQHRCSRTRYVYDNSHWVYALVSNTWSHSSTWIFSVTFSTSCCLYPCRRDIALVYLRLCIVFCLSLSSISLPRLYCLFWYRLFGLCCLVSVQRHPLRLDYYHWYRVRLCTASPRHAFASRSSHALPEGERKKGNCKLYSKLHTSWVILASRPLQFRIFLLYTRYWSCACIVIYKKPLSRVLLFCVPLWSEKVTISKQTSYLIEGFVRVCT